MIFELIIDNWKSYTQFNTKYTKALAEQDTCLISTLVFPLYKLLQYNLEKYSPVKAAKDL